MKKLKQISIYGSIALMPFIPGVVGAESGNTLTGVLLDTPIASLTQTGNTSSPATNSGVSTIASTQSQSWATGATNTGFLLYGNNETGIAMWKTAHCAPVIEGFEWAAPLNLYANTSTCGLGIDPSKTHPSIVAQLEYQQKKLSEGFLQNDRKIKNQYENILLTLSEYTQAQNTAFNQKKSDEEQYTILLQYMNKIFMENESLSTIPVPLRNIIAHTYISDSIKYAHKNSKEIQDLARNQNLALITDYFERFKDFWDSDYIFIKKNTYDLYFPINEKKIFDDETIIVSKKSIENTGNGVSDVNAELIWAPDWIKLSNLWGQIYILKVDNSQGNTKDKTYRFQIKITNKDSGKSFIQDYSVTFVDKNELINGIVGKAGWTFTSPDNTYTINVAPNILDKEYHFSFFISPETKNWSLVTDLIVKEDINKNMQEAFNIINEGEKKYLLKSSFATGIDDAINYLTYFGNKN